MALAVGITASVTFLSNLNSATDFFSRIYDRLFSANDLKISAVNARLVPVRPRADISTPMDNDAFVALQLRNYGKSPVQLTSAELMLLNSHDISTRGSTGGGYCMLAADPNTNRSPVIIDPGQTKWVAAAMALRFKGLLKSLAGTGFENIVVFDSAPQMPMTIMNAGYIQTLNAIMADRYGPHSAVRMTLKINLDEDEISFILPLTTGGNSSMQKGERFQQDWFLANLKEPTMVPYLNLSNLSGKECDIDKIIHFPELSHQFD
ncbi:hypothetical protein F3J38_04810 [Pantoea sp. Acro-805]|uniref:Uncharacterized protein n=1 Tax=Candidatus Pantoea formicae TaxID=2608355 RepID=A0ABX0QUV3_9GAMM|nr:hypothetical protein [Pantoea formicae]NIE99399.1 hypothetical protein [Pantoea formicae]